MPGSQSNKDSSPCYKFLALVIGLALTWLILRHPLLFDNHPKELNTLVPRVTYVNKQIPQLHTKIKNLGTQNLGYQTTLRSDDDQKVFEYVTNTLLDDKDPGADISNDKITPLQKTMLVMGCYGANLTEINHLLQETTARVDDPKTTPAFFYNFMLEAFDQFESKKIINDKSFTRATRDKSICSCLRDFATPSLLKVSNDDDAYNCSAYSYDNTCRMQNLIDYTIDSPKTAVNAEINRIKAVLPYKPADSLRNRVDPFLQEIDTYETTALKTISNYDTSNLLFTATDAAVAKLKTFIENYCMKVLNSETVGLQCPPDWFENNKVKNSIAVKTVVTKMKTWPAYMRTYNKVRNPKIPNSMDKMSYNNYIKKYKAGFEMCSSFAIDSYSIQITGQTKYVHWYVLGELFLLLAAFLSFMWSRIVTKAIDNTADADFFSIFERFVYVAICGIIAVYVGLITVFSGVYQVGMQEFENQENIDTHNMNFFTGFVGVFIVLAIVLVLFVTLIFIANFWFVKPIESFFKCVCGRWFQNDYAKVEGVDTDNSLRCKKQLFTAQIVQDLPVILGLTFMAVGTTLQRGVSNYNLILTVIVLITTTGLTTHMTNVLRIMSLRFQGKIMKEDSDSTNLTASMKKGTNLTASMKKVQFNRVLIGAIIGFMLVVFLNLAGLDSVQGLEFASIHQTWFAIAAFVILVCGDLSLELLAVFQRVFADENHYLLDSVAKKSNHTGWLILISLCVLQLHSRHWICPKYGILDQKMPQYCSNWF